VIHTAGFASFCAALTHWIDSMKRRRLVSRISKNSKENRVASQSLALRMVWGLRAPKVKRVHSIYPTVCVPWSIFWKSPAECSQDMISHMQSRFIAYWLFGQAQLPQQSIIHCSTAYTKAQGASASARCGRLPLIVNWVVNIRKGERQWSYIIYYSKYIPVRRVGEWMRSISGFMPKWSVSLAPHI
jgi:hypothetical protein